MTTTNPVARDLYNQAAALHNKGLALGTVDSAMKYRLFSSAVEADPTFQEAWYSTGNANSDLGFRESAVACFRRAIELDPDDAKALTNLGHCLYHAGKHDEARRVMERAIELEPEFGFAWTNLSLIQSIEGQLDASLVSAKRGYELEPEPVSEMALAFAYLFNRQWALGLKHLEARFAYKLKHFMNYPYPQWQGEPLEGKTLYLPAEQGLGDALSFLRFIPHAAEKGGQLFIQTHAELVRIAGNMVAPFRNVMVGPLSPTIPPADYWCSITSVPVALGLSDAEIEDAPGLKVPYQHIGSTIPWKVSGRRLHVGIAWAGAPDNGIDVWRSMKMQHFLDLYRVPGIQLYSLQIGPRVNDLHEAGATALVKDLSPYIRDVSDTAAIVRELDLVITVETSLGHIAGAVNADCWVLYAHNGGDYRLGRDPETNGALWYPRTRIFKQGKDARWEPVIERVVAALMRRVLA